jgi:Ca-activated chloride channel homolog
VKFGHPLWLAAGGLACLCLLWLWHRYDIRQHAALARFVSAHLRTQLTQSVSVGRRRLQRGLTLLALALLFVALSGPLVGYRWELVNRRGIEIIFAVDTSRSMSTPDVKPDRLTRAKLAIDDFTNELDGDAIGLVAFAGEAFLVCPMTLDYGAFHESLNAIDINTIPRGGTNIAAAIRGAQAALRRRPGSDKILILVTDGEDLEGDALTAAQAAASQDSLRIYTIGVGTAQGDLIPLSDNPNGGFVKDESGEFVKSRLDEPALKAIAAATGGQYAPLGPQGQGFEALYQSSLAPLLKHNLASRQQRVYIERYQWPLSGALALLLLSQIIGSRRRVRARSRVSYLKRRNWAGPAAASLLLPLTLSPWSGPARASPTSAQQAYDKGDFAAATREYAAAAQRDPKTPALQFNVGAAAYRAGQFPQAAQAFQASISRSVSGDAKRLAEQEDAYYNLGNTLYRTGQGTLQSSQQQTLQSWEQAVKAYDTALELRADDADAKYNRDLVKRKIDELKKNPPPPNPQNNKNNQGNQPNNQQQQGPQQKPPQNSQQPPKDGTPPPGQQPPGQPPPGKQPPGQQPPGQQPPGQQPPGQQPPGQQPPGQQPPGQQPPGQQPPGQQPPGQQPPPSGQQPPGQPPPGNAGGDADQDDSQHAPGQMSREEARQLLDSQKGEERHALGVPLARKEPNAPPDKPVRDW